MKQRVRIAGVGGAGLVTDTGPSLLGQNALTEGYNWAVEGNSVRSMLQDWKLFDLDIKPLWQFAWATPLGVQKLFVSDGVVVYLYDMDGTYIDVTPEDGLTTGATINFTNLNSVAVMNSTLDGPFYYDTPDEQLKPLPGWDADWTCNYMAAVRYYLVALGMTEDGDYFPHKVRWSTAAADGEIPTIWAPAADNFAGDDLLGESEGAAIGATLWRDNLFVLKEDAVYSGVNIGGQYVFQFQRLSGEYGISDARSVCEVKGGVAVATSDDLLLFDGTQWQSLAADKVRRYLREASNGIGHVLYYPAQSWVVLMVDNQGTGRPEIALVFDLLSGQWFPKLLGYSYGACLAFVGDREQKDWLSFQANAADTAWWVSAVADEAIGEEVAEYYEANLTRTGIPLGEGSGKAMLHRAWVEFRGPSSGAQCSFGVQDYLDGDVSWSDWQDISEDASFPLRALGRFGAFRYRYEGRDPWRLDGISLEWSPAGDR